MRRLTLSMLATIFALAGCSNKTELPLKQRDIRICGSDSHIIQAVRSEAARRGLSFHYGTHAVDYGTQITFRLIGDGFEIVLFNSESQDDFALRVYGTGPGEDDKERAISEFTHLATTIMSDPTLACAMPPRAGPSDEPV
ncbi:MAG: hypothetical protein ACK4VY_11310 [Brevundimonas sp.]